MSISLLSFFNPFPAVFESGEAGERQAAGDAEQAVGEGRKAEAAEGHRDGEQRQRQRRGSREAREAAAGERSQLPSEAIAVATLRECSSASGCRKLLPPPPTEILLNMEIVHEANCNRGHPKHSLGANCTPQPSVYLVSAWGPPHHLLTSTMLGPTPPVTFRTRAAPPPTKIVPMLGQCRTPSPAPTPPPILPLPPPSPTGSRGGSRETRTASLGIPPLPSTRVKLPAPTVWVAGEASAMPPPRLPQSMG